jgi:hypothetical protein
LGFSVVEVDGGVMNNFDSKHFPKTIQPGDAIVQKGISFVKDATRTKKLKIEIKDLMDDLFVD